MVNFVVHEIDETKGNNKAEKKFTLSSKESKFVENEGFNIYLDYKNSSKELVEVTAEQLFKIIENAKVNLSLEELEHHLKKFKNLRKTDFFIHKHLEKFLKEQLDYYLKTKVLTELTTMSEVDLNIVRVIKVVAEFIIKFIASLEELQKLLWEKKKFAYDVNYIITLDKLCDELLDEIVSLDVFDEQIEEWKDLGLIEVFDKSEYRDGLLTELKEKYCYLPLDTKFFDDEIKYRILATFENLDDALDGVLINSDNFHGLNYLQKRFREKIKCVYIDPPYNTGSDGFAYKDNYQHSSWLSMMSDRILLTSNLMNYTSLLYVQIDDNENHNLNMLFDNNIEYEQLVEMYIQTRYSEKTLVEDMDFQKLIEIIKVYKKDTEAKLIKETDEYTYEKFEFEIVTTDSPIETTSFGNKKVEIYKKGSYNIVQKNSSKLLLKKIYASGKILSGNSSGRFFRDYLLGRENEDGYGTLYKVYDIGADMYDYRYFTGPKIKTATKGIYYQGVPLNKMEESSKELTINNYFNYSDSFGNCRHEGGVELRSGKKPEKLLQKIINYSLSEDDLDSYVLDYFAGSGTTPAVAHKMNKKYLAIEMGEYFDELVLKRMKYTFYGKSRGIESTVKGGFLKYLSLEQYEDTLENSKLHSSVDTEEYVKDLEKLKEFMPKLYSSKYLSLYKDFSLKESRALLMNDEVFFNPFEFRLRVNIESEIVEKKMDLVETFNTLKGLEVQTIKYEKLHDKRYVFVETQNELIVWREFDEKLNKNEELAFLEEYGDLTKELYINGITQTHTQKELMAKELIFELRALLIEGVDLHD